MAQSDTRPYRIALVDNDALVLHVLTSLMKRYSQVTVCWSAQNGQDALESYRKSVAGIGCMPDIIITDISMRGMSGLELAAAIRFEDAKTPILGVTSYAPAVYESEAFDSGMQGIVEKDEVESLMQAIAQLLQGAPLARAHGEPFETPARAHLRLLQRGKPAILTLSDNERDVMNLCVQGFSTSAIAQQLNTNPSTIKTYISRVMKKLDVTTRREAVAIWSKKVGL